MKSLVTKISVVWRRASRRLSLLFKGRREIAPKRKVGMPGRTRIERAAGLQ